MTLRLPRLIRTALTIVCAAMAALLTGDDVVHAQEKVRSVQLPWQGTDDEIAVNLAIGSLRDSLMKWLTTERGVHAETLLSSIGVIAGFAAQTALLDRVKARNIPLPAGADRSISSEALGEHLRKSDLLMIASTASGEHFYFGDLLNGYLVSQRGSKDALWGFVAAAAVGAGVKPSDLPDCNPMFTRVAKSIGKPEFGVVEAGGLRPHMDVRETLEELWPRAKFILSRTDGQGVVEPAKGRSVPAEYWPQVAAQVAAQYVTMAKGTVDPRVAVALIMESAIAASKVDPKTVPQDVAKTQ